MIKLVNRLNLLRPKNLVIGVLFSVMLVLSAVLGIASKQGVSAVFLSGSTSSTTSSQSFGTAPKASGSTTLGTTPGKESVGTAPTQTTSQKSSKKKSSVSSMVPASKPKTSSVKTAQASTAPKSKPTTVTTATTQPLQQPASSTASEQKEQSGTTEPTVSPSKKTVLVASATLPTTGPEQAFGLFAGTSLAGFLGHKLYLRRKR